MISYFAADIVGRQRILRRVAQERRLLSSLRRVALQTDRRVRQALFGFRFDRFPLGTGRQRRGATPVAVPADGIRVLVTL